MRISQEEIFGPVASIIPFEDEEDAIRIANGYSSTYAAEVGRDIMKYYYETDPVDEIITGEAAEISETTSGD